MPTRLFLTGRAATLPLLTALVLATARFPAQAQNLFVDSYFNGTIVEITPGGVKSTFASGLSYPQGMAFNSAGVLFATDINSDTIYEFTPGGVRSTFASTGLAEPVMIAFEPVPEPSVLGLLAVGVTALLVRRRNLSA